VAVLLTGAAGSARSLVQNHHALASLLRADDGAGWGYASLEPVARVVRDELPAGARVAVLSQDDEPWIWMRYLAYPRPVEWLPLRADGRPARPLPPGETFLVVTLTPGARASSRVEAVLSQQLSGALTLLHDDPAGAPLYRATR